MPRNSARSPQPRFPDEGMTKSVPLDPKDVAEIEARAFAEEG
jgi:hypothetical protein